MPRGKARFWSRQEWGRGPRFPAGHRQSCVLEAALAAEWRARPVADVETAAFICTRAEPLA